MLAKMAWLSHENRTIMLISAFLLAVAVALVVVARMVCSDLQSAAMLVTFTVTSILVVGSGLVWYLTSSQLPDRRRVLSHADARATYDALGAKIQDTESAYGGPATRSLIGAAKFGMLPVDSVFEFGCGPGRLVRKLLDEELPSSCRYVAVDQSPVMVTLARRRLAAEIANGRCEVLLTDGDPRAPEVCNQASESFDVFVSTYVLDLLSEDDATLVLAEAWRLLRPGGRLCLSGITFGQGLLSRVVAGLWELVHWVQPATVGGCRHQYLLPYLESAASRGIGTLYTRRISLALVPAFLLGSGPKWLWP